MSRWMKVSIPSTPRPKEVKSQSLALVPTQETKLEKKRAPVGRRALASGRRGKRRRGAVSSLPPPLHTVPVVNHTYRFAMSSTIAFANASNITRNMLCGAIGGICTAANATVRGWASSARVNYIKVYPAAGGTAGVIWTDASGTAEGALFKDDAINEEVPTGITVDPKPLLFRPPRGSYLSMWQALNVNPSDVIMQAYGSSGSIFDVNVSFTLVVNLAGPTSTVATGALSAHYYLALDGTSSHVWVPQGLPTTN